MKNTVKIIVEALFVVLIFSTLIAGLWFAAILQGTY